MSNNIDISVPIELASIIERTIRQYKENIIKHEYFPNDLIHQCALVVEEVGEAMQSANDGNVILTKNELYDTLSVGIRMLTYIDL